MDEPVRAVDSCRFHEDPGDTSSIEIVVEGFNLSVDIRITGWSMKSTVHPVVEAETYEMKPPSRVWLVYTALNDTLNTYVSTSRSKSPELSSLTLSIPSSISRLSFGEISVRH